MGEIINKEAKEALERKNGERSPKMGKRYTLNI